MPQRPPHEFWQACGHSETICSIATRQPQAHSQRNQQGRAAPHVAMHLAAHLVHCMAIRCRELAQNSVPLAVTPHPRTLTCSYKSPNTWRKGRRTVSLARSCVPVSHSRGGRSFAGEGFHTGSRGASTTPRRADETHRMQAQTLAHTRVPALGKCQSNRAT